MPPRVCVCGPRCAEGRGGEPVDAHEACRWWLGAAEGGDARSQFELGHCYAKGCGARAEFVNVGGAVSFAGFHRVCALPILTSSRG